MKTHKITYRGHLFPAEDIAMDLLRDDDVPRAKATNKPGRAAPFIAAVRASEDAEGKK